MGAIARLVVCLIRNGANDPHARHKIHSCAKSNGNLTNPPVRGLTRYDVVGIIEHFYTTIAVDRGCNACTSNEKQLKMEKLLPGWYIHWYIQAVLQFRDVSFFDCLYRVYVQYQKFI